MEIKSKEAFPLIKQWIEIKIFITIYKKESYNFKRNPISDYYIQKRIK